ncbi:unnamed protein product [Pleuronectes platessa]|uniref:BMP/retinoic acid-inducible neural-specific protein 1 n=1 Tax=Pleuronectes platessa TaxID=8262 RepID=A0A9N7VE86_PLEPL|nr:unnamed protein product [Pleuronectes platessa]
MPVFDRRSEFARWKVRNTAIERRDLIRNPVPLMPEFQRSVRLLGRRPTTQQFIDTIIKKYGTHILISATLGGEEALTMYLAKNKLDRKLVNSTQNVEALHQLASSYFIDRDGTMRKLHEIQISTNAIKLSLLGRDNWTPRAPVRHWLCQNRVLKPHRVTTAAAVHLGPCTCTNASCPAIPHTHRCSTAPSPFKGRPSKLFVAVTDKWIKGLWQMRLRDSRKSTMTKLSKPDSGC